jgi:hypothetical protein
MHVVKTMKYNKGKIRKWINRDDGRHFQVGNYNLNGIEILGWILIITCFVGLALTQHTLNQRHKYISIGIGIIGFALYMLGIHKNDKIKDK